MARYDPLAIAADLPPFEFHPFAQFNGGAFAVFHGSGVDASQWEMHPDTDELLFVLPGTVTVELLTDGQLTRIPLTRGQLVIVPRGAWHRHREPHDLVELYYTPGRSVASDDDDPRTTPPANWVDVTPVADVGSQ